jgi:very-short-patch-repair endonuclease
MRRQHHTRRIGVTARGAAGLRESPERAIAAIAGRQHGVIARAQLLEIGLEPRAIDRRIEAGRLHRQHRGIYLVGHRAAAPKAREMAAALACGPGAVVSHRSAAQLWALLPYPARDRAVEVTVPTRDPGEKPGIRVHRVRALDRRDVRTCDGVPITTPARTILDLGARATAREVEQALAEALRRGLVRRPGLRDVLSRAGRRHGTALVRSLVEDDVAPSLTRSEAEDRLLALIRAGELPQPDVNVRVGDHEVDLLCRDERLVVEVDGFGFHASRAEFERDRLRDAELQALGFRVMRVTWRQLTRKPEATLARIARALSV